MALDDFFNECRKKGSIPLSYRSHTEFINGSKTVEYENPDYKKAKENLAKILGMKQTGNRDADNLVSMLYGEDVVIRTKDGYHHGRLCGYDGKNFMLETYHFDREPLDIADYAMKSAFGEDTMVPANGVISVSRIPLMLYK